jgi:hypothetical protein
MTSAGTASDPRDFRLLDTAIHLLLKYVSKGAKPETRHYPTQEGSPVDVVDRRRSAGGYALALPRAGGLMTLGQRKGAITGQSNRRRHRRDR